MSGLLVNISLRFFHPSVSAESIREEIGLESRFARSAGEPRPARQGEDQQLYEFTYLSIPLARKVNVELDEEISRWCNFLINKREFIGHITDTGGRAEFYISIFVGGLGGFELDRAVLTRVTTLGLGLAVEIYPPSGDET